MLGTDPWTGLVDEIHPIIVSRENSGKLVRLANLLEGGRAAEKYQNAIKDIVYAVW